jgi:flavin-dependent dehydrogenase
LLLVHARRLGVDVRHGAAVDLARSVLRADGNTLACTVDGRPRTLACSVLADASGPAAVLSRHLDLRRDDASPFQTSAVWTYYENVRPLASYSWPARAQFPRDQYTQHLCFREGWLWYIPLVSWQATPTAVLERALGLVLDDPLPPREVLARELGCTYRSVVSIGLTLRADREPGLALDPAGTFERYRCRYPAIAQVLAGARRLPDYYGRGRTFHARAAFRGYSERAAGDGWLLLGDAAFFVDPLISPGLTGGVAGAFRAVEATAAALDAARADAGTFAAYDGFIHTLHAALERDNQLVYMSFDHPQAIALVQRFQEAYARRHFLDHRERPYGDDDTNVWGILDPGYAAVQQDAWEVMRAAEIEVGRRVPVARQSCRDYEPMVGRLERLLQPHLDDALTPYAQVNGLATC